MNAIPSMEQQFIEKLTKIIESNFSNELFNGSELANQLGMSRATLYRKTKLITGKTVSELINEVRLEAAEKLLKDRSGNVSEIAYLVGFKTPTYFIKCYKEYYGYSPGEILKNNRPTNSTENLIKNNKGNKRTKIPAITFSVFVFIVIILVILKSSGNTNIEFHSKRPKLPTQNQAAYNLYLQGENLMKTYAGSRNRIHFLEAKQKFENAILLDSTFGDAYCKLSSIYFSHLPYGTGTIVSPEIFEKYLDSGKVCLEKAEKYTVIDRDYYLRMNSIYYQRKGNYDEALHIFNQRWKDKPKNYNYYNERGNHGWFTYNFDDAIEHWLKYLELKPDSLLPQNDRLYKMVWLFIFTDFPGPATHFSQQYLNLTNDTSEFLRLQKRIQLHTGNYEQTIKDLTTNKNNNELTKFDFLTLIELYSLTGKHDEAKKLLAELEKLSKTSNLKEISNATIGYFYLSIGNKELAEKNFHRTIEWYENIIGKNPPARKLVYNRIIGACYSMLNDNKKGIEYIKKLNERNSIEYYVLQELHYSPIYDKMRNEPEFIELLNKLDKNFKIEHKNIKKCLKDFGLDTV